MGPLDFLKTVFERSVLFSPRLFYLITKYSTNSNIMKSYYNLK